MSTRTTIIIFIVLFTIGILLLVVLPFFYFSNSGSEPETPPPPATGSTPSVPEENAPPINRGVFRSDDGGDAWEQKIWVEGGNDSIAAFGINRLIAHPTRRDTIFLATSANGLWISESRGDLWAPVRDTKGILQDHANVQSVAVNPANPDEWYVAVYQDRRGRLLRTLDDGGTFFEVYVAPLDRFGVFDVAYDSVRGHVLIVTGQGGLFESADRGATWSVVRWFADGLVRLLVNPASPNTRFAVSAKGNLFRTTDAGETWTDVTPGFKKFKGATENQHWTMDRTGGLYLGSSYGMLRSRDNGTTFASPPLIIPAGDSVPVLAIAVDPRDRTRIVVSTASQTYRTDDDGKTWSILVMPSSLRATEMLFDAFDPNTLYTIFTP